VIKPQSEPAVNYQQGIKTSRRYSSYPELASPKAPLNIKRVGYIGDDYHHITFWSTTLSPNRMQATRMNSQAMTVAVPQK
jgi:hypothetical protein